MPTSIHFIEECICGNVLAQCRCPSPNKTVHLRNQCLCSFPGPLLPKFVEPWQVNLQKVAKENFKNFVALKNNGIWIANSTLEGFERAANIVVQLEQYCDKFTVPLSVKELRKILNSGGKVVD